MNEGYLDFAKALAEDAGRIMKKYFAAEEIGLEIKSDKTPVTLADTEINELVISEVKKRYPDHGIMGEEGSFGLERDNLWIVDPLDGTINFARRILPFAFSLALVSKGELIVGVVYEPMTERFLWASKNGGAFENGKRLRVEDKTEPGPLFISSWMVGGIENSVFSDKSIYAKTAELYAQQSNIDLNDLPIAYALALVGAGSVDALVSTIKTSWDVAAGSLVALESGAKVTDLFGNKVDRWDRETKGILAAPPSVHNLLTDILKPALEVTK